jgi:hypothetical protein
VVYRCIAPVAWDVPPDNDPGHWAAVGTGNVKTAPAYWNNPIYVGEPQAAEQNGWYHLNKFNVYNVDTRAAGFGLYLPPGPQFGDWVYICDEFLSFGARPPVFKAGLHEPLEGLVNNDDTYGPDCGLWLDRPYRGLIVFRPGERGWTLT